ncbi:5-deoxy-glucuronate isomerase [Microlunatus sp. Gsoil 973]|uniref:5-deoxy-glucuronate isomerase n=1 Tax=Microlunatus sp. Gsoil 973 TaxID=2672569 RepID=UPI0012B4A5F1|nr:5-deoxy-glucuronate isomerase [Microlunatus sp. Gsoil 973]QGN31493.1 5-deoxy-glucuronate isomerase [Microlunatus sp. Gsoil 973]
MRYTSLRIENLPAGRHQELHTGDEEIILLPLAGSVAVTCDDRTHRLAGRSSVFEGPSDFCYLPIGRTVTVRSEQGVRFALCGAKTDRELPFRYGAAEDVPIELRGAGQSSRSVRNFGTVGSFETAKLIACEVITPDGNWSSYPAHKHDRAGATESELEELYYFEIASGPDGQAGFGYMQTTASDDRPINLLEEVRHGSIVEVPYGWHGPCVAAPGFDMYYLNAMAGPGDERAWLITDHPGHAFVRASWEGQRIDPRLERRR